MDSFHDSFGYIRQRFPLPLCLGNKTGNIKIDYMILVQMCQIPRSPCNLPVVKKPTGIAGTIVVCAKHLRRVRFAKAPWPADTQKHFRCPYGLIDQCNHAGFIHIF